MTAELLSQPYPSGLKIEAEGKPPDSLQDVLGTPGPASLRCAFTDGSLPVPLLADAQNTLFDIDAWNFRTETEKETLYLQSFLQLSTYELDLLEMEATQLSGWRSFVMLLSLRCLNLRSDVNLTNLLETTRLQAVNMTTLQEQYRETLAAMRKFQNMLLATTKEFPPVPLQTESLPAADYKQVVQDAYYGPAISQLLADSDEPFSLATADFALKQPLPQGVGDNAEYAILLTADYRAAQKESTAASWREMADTAKAYRAYMLSEIREMSIEIKHILAECFKRKQALPAFQPFITYTQEQLKRLKQLQEERETLDFNQLLIDLQSRLLR